MASQAHQVSQECLHNTSSVPLSKNEDKRPRGLETDVPLRTLSSTSPHIHSGIWHVIIWYGWDYKLWQRVIIN